MNQDLTSMGRSELLDEVARLRADIADAERTRQSINFEYEAMVGNLSATQDRCTELIEEVRSLRRGVEAVEPIPAPPTREELWGYSAIFEGPYQEAGPTRESAIAEGAAFTADGESFWICAGHRPDPAEFFSVCDFDFVTQAGENAVNDAGDVVGDWPALNDSAMVDLDNLIADWARRHAPCRFWVLDGTPEQIEPRP